MIPIHNCLMNHEQGVLASQLLSLMTDFECIVARCESKCDMENPLTKEEVKAALVENVSELARVANWLQETFND